MKDSSTTKINYEEQYHSDRHQPYFNERYQRINGDCEKRLIKRRV